MSWSAACQSLIVCTFLLQVAAGQGPATRREPGEACGFSIECCAGCTCESGGGAKTCVRGPPPPTAKADSGSYDTDTLGIILMVLYFTFPVILGILVFICWCCYACIRKRYANSDEASGDSQDIEAATHAPDSHPSDDTVVASHAPDYLSSCDVVDAVSVASTPPDEDATNAAPPHMVCPISLAVMKDPCRCGDGHHNFERSYLLRHLRTNKPACPVSRIPMTADDVVSNEELKAKITEWLAEDLAAGNPVSVSAPEQHAPTSP